MKSALTAVILSLLAPSANGQVVVGWDGSGSGSGGIFRQYDRNFNWSANVPDTTNEIADFDATVTGNLTVDTSNQGGGSTPPWTVRGVTFTTGSTATVTLQAGGDFEFGGANSGIGLTGTNVSAVFQNNLTFNNAVGGIQHTSSGDLDIDGTTTLNNTMTIEHTGTGDINFNNSFSGTGGVVVDGTSTGDINFSFTDRTNTGGMVINGGVVNVNDLIDDGNSILIGVGGTSLNAGFHSLGEGNVTIDGGTLNLVSNNDHIVVTNGATLQLDSGTLNLTTTIPQTGNDFRLEYGTFVQTGGVSNFDLGDDYNMYEGSGANVNQAGQTFVSGGTFNATVRDQFRTYQDTVGTKTPTFEVSNGATANIILNGERGTGGSQSGVVMANYDDSNWNFTGCGTLVTASATAMGGATPHMVNISGNTSITDGAILQSSIPVVLNRTAVFTGDNSANLVCPTGPGELQLIGGANLYVNQTPTLTNAPNIGFESASDQSIFSVTNSAAPTTTSGGNYGLPDSNIGGTGTISGAGTIRKAGSGTLTIDSSMGTNSVDANEIRIEGGTLMLGANNQITSSTDLDLAGGTFNSNEFDATMGTLTLSDSSTIDLGSGIGSILNFDDAVYESGTLTITNWSGTTQGGGDDQIIFANNLVGSGLLGKVFWADRNIWGARQLASGEIVPIPEPGTYAMGAVLIGAVICLEYRRRKKSAAK